MSRALALPLALLLACSGHVSRDQWQQMSPQDKTLYVRSLIGEQKVRERKGGSAPVAILRTAEEYVAQIDAAYARGDRRPPEVIFEGMAQPR